MILMRWRKRCARNRRLLRWLVIGPALILLGAGCWLADHLRPRHAHFADRRGTLQSADVIEEDALPTQAAFHTATVRAQSDSGLEVTFRVLRPRNIARPVPLVVLLGGHRTGRGAVELVGDPGPIAVAALDYPYHGPEKIRGLRQAVGSLGSIQQALLDTPPAVSIALDWLLQQPWADPAQVELAGVSLGTPFAAVAGARDERFRRVWILHGGADNRAWLENTLEARIPSDFWRARTAGLLHLLAHGASFDTEYWIAQIAPRPVVVVGATADEALSRENVTRLYAAAGEPRELVWTTGGHVQANRPEIVRDLLDIVRARLPAGP